MSGTRILGGLAGALLASAMVSASSAAVPIEMCPRDNVEMTQVVPAAIEKAPAKAEEAAKPADCATDEDKTTQPSPDAVCIYKPGMEREKPAKASQSEQAAPQASTSDGRDTVIGQAWAAAAHAWSVITTAFSVVSGVYEL